MNSYFIQKSNATFSHLSFQNQMSPMGSQRNFASPSLAKRMALQHLNPPQSQDLGYCQKNIWNNPLQSIQDDHEQADISYLHSLQAQNFPHIPNNHLKQIDDLSAPRKMEIYENPSEHYASINFNGDIKNEQSTQSSLPSSQHGTSAFGNHILHQNNIHKNENGANAVNFYGYGMS